MAEPDLIIEAGFSDAKLAREVQKVVDKYKAAGKAAEKAFQDSTGKVGESQALKAHMRELDKLQRAYDPVYTATKRYEGEVEKLNRALQVGAITQGKYADSIKQAQVELGRASGVIQDAGNKARGFGGQMSNVGFQIGDFATQVGAGTSATQALGQQLPQLLGAFGTFGALAGAAAAIMIPLGSAIIKTAFDSETLAERMKGLEASTDAMADAVAAAAMPISELRAEYGDLADEVARANGAMADFTAAQAAAALKGAAGATAGLFPSAAIPSRVEGMSDPEWAAVTEGQMRKLMKATGATREEAEELAMALRRLESANGPEAVVRDAENLLTVMGKLPDASENLSAQFEAVGGLIDQAKKQLEAQRSEVTRLREEYDATTTRLNSLAADMEKAEAERAKASAAGKADEVAMWDRVIGKIREAATETRKASELADNYMQRQAQAYQQYGSTRAAGPQWRSNDAMGAAKEVIKHYEGYAPAAKWDENANRGGYGSSTVTLSDGTIQKLTAGQSVTRADAERDLERRIGGYFDEQKRVMGAAWDNLSAKQIAALTSVQHNYGSLPSRIQPALRTGDAEAIAQALAGLAMDYTASERAKGKPASGAKPMNYDRRMGEAAAFGDTSAAADAAEREMDVTKETAAALKKETNERKRKSEEVRKYGELLAANLLTEQQTAQLEQQRAAQVQAINAGGGTDEQKAAAIAQVNAEMQRQITIMALTEEAKRRQVDLDAQMVGSTMTYRQAIEALGAAKAQQAIADQAAQASADNLRQAQEFAAQQTEALKDGLVGAIIEGENFSDVLGNVAQALAKAALQAALFGEGPMASGGSGFLGGLFGGGGGFISALFGGKPSFAGGGFTGAGPRSGGIDGQGGFPAILHPNETVIDHTRGQRAGMSYSPVFNIGGNVTPEDLAAVRREAAQGFQQMRRDVPGIMDDHQKRLG